MDLADFEVVTCMHERLFFLPVTPPSTIVEWKWCPNCESYFHMIHAPTPTHMLVRKIETGE